MSKKNKNNNFNKIMSHNNNNQIKHTIFIVYQAPPGMCMIDENNYTSILQETI